jgi:type I restriction enzyme R subunit
LRVNPTEPMPGPEDTFAEQPALAWLCRDEGVGPTWTHVNGATLTVGSDSLDRATHAAVVLQRNLREALSRLSPDVPQAAITEAIHQVVTTQSPQVIEDHRAFHALLLGGITVTFTDGDGVEKTKILKLIDFEHPANNEFLAISQFTIINGQKNRRPDVLLFVNGIPLGQVELKSPGTQDATAAAAVNQVRHYQETIPQLYRFVEVIGVSASRALRRV